MKKINFKQAWFFAVLMLFTVMAVSVQAADKLVVKDAGGVNTVFRIDDTGVVEVPNGFVWDNTSKRMGLATSAPWAALHVAEQNGANPNRGIVSSQHFNGTTAAIMQYERSRGTLAAPLALVSGDAIGAFHFQGYDGSSYQTVSSIRSMVNGTVSAASVPGELWFHTGNNSANTFASPKMIITTSGNIGIGTTSPTQKIDVNSDGIRIRTAKTPASSTATCNQGDMSWDANFVYVCVAANTWKRSALASW